MSCTEKNGKRHFSPKVNSNNQSVFLRTNRTWLLFKGTHGARSLAQNYRISMSQTCRRQPLAGSSTVATFSSVHQNRPFLPFHDHANAPRHFRQLRSTMTRLDRRFWQRSRYLPSSSDKINSRRSASVTDSTWGIGWGVSVSLHHKRPRISIRSLRYVCHI